MARGHPIRSLSQRFNEKWTPEPNSGCWLWIGYTNTRGYGVIGSGSRTDDSRRSNLAHRVAWTLWCGQIPDGLDVCHHCDNPPCVNPEHLFLGTHSENMHDMINKGRGNKVRGERHHNHRVTVEDARMIRAQHLAGVPQNQLARNYQLGTTTVHKIISRQTWKEI